jgi:AAA family ATP:ADP antiporter
VTAPTGTTPAPNARLERFLSLFTDVRGGEGVRLSLLTANVFLILTAYYVMKPAREAFILDQQGGAEIKSYALAGQAVLLAAIVPLYGSLASRLPRRRLINLVTAFFVACLPVFYAVSQAGVKVGVPFFLWIGIFSLMVIAQFWAYANDIHTPEEGKRLFAVIAFGASSGAVFGAWLSGRLIEAFGVRPLLLFAAAILAASLALFNYVDLRRRATHAAESHRTRDDIEIGGSNAFALVLKSRYLLLVAGTIFLLNWCNSAGEYILSAIVKRTADARIQAGMLAAADTGRFIGGFYADYFQVVNIAGMVLQLFLVSRVIKYVGVPVAICVLPVVALGSYATAALIPSLAIVRWVKTAENSVDYSLMNTVRHMLFLPTSREEKFKAKQVIDSFVVRAGDVISAATVWLGTTVLAIGVSQFAWINVAVVLVWLGFAVATGREFARRSAAQAEHAA